MRFLCVYSGILFLAIGLNSSCGRRDVSAKTMDDQNVVTVGTAVANTRPVAQHLTLSSELVPYQEIDVYAKVAGYLKGGKPPVFRYHRMWAQADIAIANASYGWLFPDDKGASVAAAGDGGESGKAARKGAGRAHSSRSGKQK